MSIRHGLLRGVAALGTLGLGGMFWYETNQASSGQSAAHHHQGIARNTITRPTPVPSRQSQVDKLMADDEEYDVLVVGGGATGAGVALDASLRGLRVALVERGDFACETSSKSSKLLHGGVRYLQAAVLNFDLEQAHLVFEALHERTTVMEDVAPHLTNPVPIMLPVYRWWQVPYFWAGMKLYDVVAGMRVLYPSRFMTARESLRQFPTLQLKDPERRVLKGSVVYWDGQMNDARLNVSVALTACVNGAVIANYTSATRLLHGEDGKVAGAEVRDELTGRKGRVRARVVVNATGPFVDELRQLDEGDKMQPMMMASTGTHIALPNYYCSNTMGMIDPDTEDGRVLFLLPWRNRVIVGTTDNKAELVRNPVASEEDIQYILRQMERFLSVKVKREDVSSAWCGVRPLAKPSVGASTAEASRKHVIHVNPETDLITIAGGKWTTYRRMAQDTVDTVARVGDFRRRPDRCRTHRFKIIGSDLFDGSLYARLAQDHDLPTHIALHLVADYGDRAHEVMRIAKEENHLTKLVPMSGFPYLEAEVVYVVRQEMASTPMDVLARRLRLAFVDASVAREALPRVVEIMAKELGWSGRTKRAQQKAAEAELDTFGAPSTAAADEARSRQRKLF